MNKWAIAADAAAALGVSGECRTRLLALEIMDRATGANVREILSAIRAAVRDDDHVSNTERGAKAYPQSFILATKTAVFDIDAAFAIDRIVPGELWARGIGMEFALGCAFTTAGKPGKDRVRWALEAACKYSVHCGGELFVMNLTTGERHV